MNFNKSDILFIEPSEMDMMISIQIHEHILNSVFLALLIGLTVGLIIGLNCTLITEIIKKKIEK